MENKFYYVNNKKVKALKSKICENDVVEIVESGKNVNVRHYSKGYGITLPASKVKVDLSLNKLIAKFFNDDFCLTISYEDKNVYEGFEGFKIYHDDWMCKYLGVARFLKDRTSKERLNYFFKNNNLAYSHKPVISEDIIKGYDVEIYNIVINDNKKIKYPYYNIAIVRKPDSINNFYILNFKSSTDMYAKFNKMLKGFKMYELEGKANNYTDYKVDESTLDKKTLKYYNKLVNQDYTGFGFFRASMFKDNKEQDKRIEKYNDIYENEYFDYKMDIMPTYTHTNWQKEFLYFPLESAKKYAGGDGFNGKRVLQFTLQFTSNNNTDLYGHDPIFDIYRGKYDKYFKQMAEDLKKYKQPVLFRLNNEMNTDWTSYCGMVTLIDPDIFKKTWQRMADIFYRNGAKNVLFIFNNNALSFPYSSWGDGICYFPGSKYVHILGLTYYEFNNYTDNSAPKSFEELYSWLYNKNSEFFKNYIAIISEFACGAGGELSGERYRNQNTQANYVKEMFEILNRKKNKPEFARQIKGAVWFSCNDANEKGVFNQLEIDDNLKGTIKEFKKGFKRIKELKGE